MPPFLEVTETTTGSLDMMSDGRPLHFCNDVATADTYRHLPAFSIEGLRLPVSTTGHHPNQRLFAVQVQTSVYLCPT